MQKAKLAAWATVLWKWPARPPKVALGTSPP